MRKIKKRINLYIDIEIIKHAKRNPLINGLSAFINNIYFENFLDIDSKRNLMEEHHKEFERIRTEISQDRDLERSLTKQQRVAIKDEFIPLLSKGYDIAAIHRRFNNNYNSGLTLIQFKKIIQIIRSKQQQ